MLSLSRNVCKHVMFFKGLVCVLVLSFSQLSMSNDYQFDASIKQGHNEREAVLPAFIPGDRRVQDTDNFTRTSLTYYFSPVRGSAGPLKKSGFLSQSSSVFFSTIFTTDKHILQGRYVSPYSAWITGAEVQVEGSDIDQSSIHVGKYITPAMSVAIQYQDYNDSDVFSILTESVKEVGKNNFWGLASAVSYDELRLWSTSLSMDYYLTSAFNLGVRVDSQENQFQWELNSRYFVTQNISGELTFIKTSVDDFSLDLGGIEVKVDGEETFYSFQVNTRF